MHLYSYALNSGKVESCAHCHKANREHQVCILRRHVLASGAGRSELFKERAIHTEWIEVRYSHGVGERANRMDIC